MPELQLIQSEQNSLGFTVLLRDDQPPSKRLCDQLALRIPANIHLSVTLRLHLQLQRRVIVRSSRMNCLKDAGLAGTLAKR